MADKLTFTLDTGDGDNKDVVIKLRPDLAPGHVERITTLAGEGFYALGTPRAVGEVAYAMKVYFFLRGHWGGLDAAELVHLLLLRSVDSLCIMPVADL